jgi:hypothetical protein
MKIKCSKDRIEFERFLRKLGYKNRSPAYKVKRYRGNILENEIDPIKIEFFMNLHKNKKSYLWYCYQELTKDEKNKVSEKELKENILMIAKQINFKNNRHAKMAEIGWEVKMQHTIITWGRSRRTKLYIKILRSMKKILEHGILEKNNIVAKEGDILISRPGGPAFGSFNNIGGPNDRPGKKRGKINQKFFKFGPVNSYGDQYAIYDENLKLKPVII